MNKSKNATSVTKKRNIDSSVKAQIGIARALGGRRLLTRSNGGSQFLKATGLKQKQIGQACIKVSELDRFRQVRAQELLRKRLNCRYPYEVTKDSKKLAIIKAKMIIAEQQKIIREIRKRVSQK